jgi:hypothetical protein
VTRIRSGPRSRTTRRQSRGAKRATIPAEISDRFYQSMRTAEVPFVINDAVGVASAFYAGHPTTALTSDARPYRAPIPERAPPWLVATALRVHAGARDGTQPSSLGLWSARVSTPHPIGLLVTAKGHLRSEGDVTRCLAGGSRIDRPAPRVETLPGAPVSRSLRPSGFRSRRPPRAVRRRRARLASCLGGGSKAGRPLVDGPEAFGPGHRRRLNGAARPVAGEPCLLPPAVCVQTAGLVRPGRGRMTRPAGTRGPKGTLPVPRPSALPYVGPGNGRHSGGENVTPSPTANVSRWRSRFLAAAVIVLAPAVASTSPTYDASITTLPGVQNSPTPVVLIGSEDTSSGHGEGFVRADSTLGGRALASATARVSIPVCSKPSRSTPRATATTSSSTARTPAPTFPSPSTFPSMPTSSRITPPSPSPPSPTSPGGATPPISTPRS